MNRKKGVFFSYILLLVEVFSSLLFTPFLIRSLGQSEYGLFSLVSSITAYLMLLDLGVGNAVIRYMAKYRVLNDKKKQENFLGVTTIFYVFIGVVIIIFGIFLKGKLPIIFGSGLTSQELDKAMMMFSITMINAALTLVLAPFDKTIIAFEQFAVSKKISIIKTILRVFILVIILNADGNAISIVKVNLLMTILFGFVSIFFVILKLKIIPRVGKVSKGFIKEIFGYSSFIFIQMIATQINAMTDKVLLGAMTSTVIVGIYTVGAQISNYFESIAGSINGILMPGVVRLVEYEASPKRLLNEMIRIGRLIFMLLGIIWVTFFVFGQSFIILWAGKENALGYWVGVIIMFPMVLSLTQAVGTQILWAKGKHQIQAYLKIIVSVLNIVLTIVLIRWASLIGASVGTAISMIIGDIVVMNIVFGKYLYISMKEYYIRLFKGILPSLFFSLMVGFIIKAFGLHSWIGFIINCCLLIAFYTIVMIFYGMNEYENKLLRTTFKQILSRFGI